MDIIEEKSQPEAGQSVAGKIFFAVMGILIIASVGATYWRIMIKKDYVIEAQTDCDPYMDECFIWECDLESDVEGEACTGDSETDSWYFQVIRRNASNVPLCDPNDEECDALVCGENEPECEYEFCTEENMEEQYAVACNDPEQYVLNNPMEGEICDLENIEDCTENEEEGIETEGEGSMEEEGVVEEDNEGAEVTEEVSDCDPELEDCPEVSEPQQEICEDTGEVCPL